MSDEQIVLHCSGSGEIATSPIRLKGVDLVIYVTPPADAKSSPLVLFPRVLTSPEQPALIDVEDGSLELINVRLTYDNKTDLVAPATMLRVRGGDLRLFGCRLQGALDKMPPNYAGLIEW